ncbi:hypothetical protein G7Y89_g637 [Cudoniella acicularis]|uniref:Uncharacterized protein n=1 Tax=Cudoniella acicularis TaxID=354080 RepID=A0A8H4RXT4_9HELO|nr:hypothetical protein G7Y89_g637 [Cudoniella acicularis]
MRAPERATPTDAKGKRGVRHSAESSSDWGWGMGMRIWDIGLEKPQGSGDSHAKCHSATLPRCHGLGDGHGGLGLSLALALRAAGRETWTPRQRHRGNQSQIREPGYDVSWPVKILRSCLKSYFDIVERGFLERRFSTKFCVLFIRAWKRRKHPDYRAASISDLNNEALVPTRPTRPSLCGQAAIHHTHHTSHITHHTGLIFDTEHILILMPRAAAKDTSTSTEISLDSHGARDVFLSLSSQDSVPRCLPPSAFLPPSFHRVPQHLHPNPWFHIQTNRRHTAALIGMLAS